MADESRAYEIHLVPRFEAEVLNELRALLDNDDTSEGCAQLLADLNGIAWGLLDGKRERYVHSPSTSPPTYCRQMYGCAAYYAYGLTHPDRFYWLGFCVASERFRFYQTVGDRIRGVP